MTQSGPAREPCGATVYMVTTMRNRAGHEPHLGSRICHRTPITARPTPTADHRRPTAGHRTSTAVHSTSTAHPTPTDEEPAPTDFHVADAPTSGSARADRIVHDHYMRPPRPAGHDERLSPTLRLAHAELRGCAEWNVKRLPRRDRPTSPAIHRKVRGHRPHSSDCPPTATREDERRPRALRRSSAP